MWLFGVIFICLFWHLSELLVWHKCMIQLVLLKPEAELLSCSHFYYIQLHNIMGH